MRIVIDLKLPILYNDCMSEYHNNLKKETILNIRALVRELPTWYSEFLRAIEINTSVLTRLNYTYDTRIFLNYLVAEHRSFQEMKISDITPRQIDDLTLTDLEIYIEYIGYYVTKQNHERENTERGKARKIYSLRSLFKYLYKKELIKDNPSALLEMPKIHEKAIVRLSSIEVTRLLDVLESGEGLTERQKLLQQYTQKRDIAMITLFLTTGIRVSELVGLNINDINFEDMSFKVLRKGGNESILYFDFETDIALGEYLEERKLHKTFDIPPLFLSMQKKRISVRAVEQLVKKYARVISPLKNITPHKLRSTFGTELYQETGDIYLVADVLGHKDVNTTRKFYSDMSEENRRKAARSVKLRKDKDEKE